MIFETVIPVAVGLGLYWRFWSRRPHVRFWKLASKHPDIAYDFFKSRDCWYVFEGGLPDNYREIVPWRDWTGPFRFYVPKLGGRWVVVFAQAAKIEESQEEFVGMMTGMNPRDYDPSASLAYLDLLRDTFSFFHDVSSHEDLVRRLGADRLTDVTELPKYQAMEAIDPLPAGFFQRVYQFRDPYLGRGVFDACFRDRELVNLRVQLFFDGWFARGKARRFLWRSLIPALQEMFGEPIERAPEYFAFRKGGILSMGRYVPGTPSVSVYLTAEHYA